MRPWKVWLGFVASLAVVLTALAWISLAALELDRTEAEAQLRAVTEENLRLSLWRLDSAVAPIVARENSFPYFAYSAFYPTERAYTRMFAQIERGEVLVPSPLLDVASPFVSLNFQQGPDGLSSPQVPLGNMRDLAETGFISFEDIEAARGRLAALEAGVDLGQLRVQVLRPRSPVVSLDNNLGANDELKLANVAGPRNRSGNQQSQLMMNTNEYVARNWVVAGNPAQQTADWYGGAPLEAVVDEGSFQPVWKGGQLLLVRHIAVGDLDYLQGCWLDWPRLQAWLLESIGDLMPGARLTPCADPGDQERRLATLPVRLEPGEASAEQAPAPMSHLRFALLVAWMCFALASGAVAALLAGAISLSERRGAFVSAVTHELRTPLTTFRMYTDMLAEGMVRKPEKRQRYLETLRREADRLGHLVENVLSYARLERSGTKAAVADHRLAGLLAGIQRRLIERAERADMQLQIAELPEDATLRADATAVEQILFNLVDNACKYAAEAQDKRIHLQVAVAGSKLVFRLCDHGPGVAAKEARRLFQPFRKSARDAAHSAPGVGLGLALSRRLARAMGGELRADTQVAEGACFVLELPAASSAQSA